MGRRKIVITPEFTITSNMVNLLAEITKMLTRLEYLPRMDLPLRRTMRLQTIQGMLAIDGIGMPMELIAAIRDNKHDILTPLDIEVRNAIKVYREADAARWNLFSVSTMNYIHKMLMPGGMSEYTKGMICGVGIDTDGIVTRRNLPADKISDLIANLLESLKDTMVHPLIAVPAFHYELEHIHPFALGNSRVGWLWQMLLLKSWNKLFAYFPVEQMIYKDREHYVSMTNYSTETGDCAHYIEFMLHEILDTMNQVIFTLETTQETTRKVTQETTLKTTREKILEVLKNRPKTSKNELACLLDCSPDLIKYHMQKLINDGVIARVGSTKGGRWEVCQ
ncbi:MAG: Fic family protein [Paludibacteraceae bacterium]|nr:Fic family protein [Paludibacteraceae bacterium]